ncbi:MAG: hypothetical protein KatS3mg100_529 [Candidatus Parcubacteria bacterium]|nr:MAG: hypothetical protein KatS3mg100_529 [Candidatus Parcubacteria bacterium]
MGILLAHLLTLEKTVAVCERKRLKGFTASSENIGEQLRKIKEDSDGI